MNPKELVDAACRVLRLSDDRLFREFGKRLEEKWRSTADDAQPLIRANIAAILALYRVFGDHDNSIDYTLLALAQGDKGGRDYLENQLPKWEQKKRNS